MLSSARRNSSLNKTSTVREEDDFDYRRFAAVQNVGDQPLEILAKATDDTGATERLALSRSAEPCRAATA
jgi:hypothetical protein